MITIVYKGSKVYSVWDAARVFYFIAKINCYIAFSFDGNYDSGKIKTTFWDAFFATASSLLMCLMIYINITNEVLMITTKSFIIDKGNQFLALMMIIMVLGSTIQNVFKRYNIWNILKRLHLFDKEINSLEMVIDHKKNYKYGLGIIIGINSVLSSMFVISFIVAGRYFHLREAINVATTFAIIYANNTMCFTIFIALVYITYERFNLINNCLKMHFAMDEKETETFAKTSHKKDLKRIVMKLADLHDNLVDVVGEMNYCFSFQIIAVVASVFGLNLFSTFAIYRVFVRDDLMNFSKSLVQMMWNVYFLTLAIVTVSLTSLMTRTGKLTAVYVHKAINFLADEDDPIIDYLKIFSQQMLHRAPTISTGFFVLDFTLLFTIIGATATYIVILIQFDSEKNTGGKVPLIPPIVGQALHL